MQVYVSLWFQLETSGQVLDHTKTQWNMMMRKMHRWMGNVVMGDDCTPVDSYLALEEKHLKLMLHSIYGVQ